MKVLITGGAGFVGSHLAGLHLGRGDEVHVVDDLSTGRLENLGSYRGNERLRFEQADILVWTGITDACAWADRVYHLAAVVGVFRVLREPARVFAVNAAGTERLLRALRDSGSAARLLLASTSEVYGPENAGELDEETILHLHAATGGRWSYAVSKLASESVALSYGRQFDLGITVVRLFNTIGPRQTGNYGMVVPRFVSQAVAGEPITVFGDGSQSRCFCDVRDTVAALDALLDHSESVGEVFNVGGSREVEIGDLARLVRDRAESASEIEFIPHEEAYGEAVEEIARRRPRLAKLRRLIRFQPRHDLVSTLDELIRAERSGSVGAARAAEA